MPHQFFEKALFLYETFATKSLIFLSAKTNAQSRQLAFLGLAYSIQSLGEGGGVRERGVGRRSKSSDVCNLFKRNTLEPSLNIFKKSLINGRS